jgi:hypothetical protein
MGSAGNFFKRLKDGIAEFIGGLGMFSKDVGSKAYEKTVDLVANGVIVVLGAIFFVFIGATVLQWWEGLEDDKLNYVDREIRGLVTDAYTGYPLEGVTVAIVDQVADTTRTDANGAFTLQFRAHKDDNFTELSFRKGSYIGRAKEHPIPLDEPASLSVQTFTLRPEIIPD